MTIKEVNQAMKDLLPVRYNGKPYVLCGFQRYFHTNGKIIQNVALRDINNSSAIYWVSLADVKLVNNPTNL